MRTTRHLLGSPSPSRSSSAPAAVVRRPPRTVRSRSTSHSSNPGFASDLVEHAAREIESIDVVEPAVVRVDLDEQFMWLAAASARESSLRAVERGPVDDLATPRRRHSPGRWCRGASLVAVHVLDVEEMTVVVRPAVGVDPALGVRGDRSRVSAVTDPTQTFSTPSTGRRYASRSPSGERRGLVRSGFPNSTSSGMRSTNRASSEGCVTRWHVNVSTGRDQQPVAGADDPFGRSRPRWHRVRLVRAG